MRQLDQVTLFPHEPYCYAAHGISVSPKCKKRDIRVDVNSKSAHNLNLGYLYIVGWPLSRATECLSRG